MTTRQINGAGDGTAVAGDRGGPRRRAVPWIAATVLVLAASTVAGCSSSSARGASGKPAPGPAGRATLGASIAPLPSSGCRPPGAALTPGQQKVTIVSSGQPRWFYRYVPASYHGTVPVPLVVDVHGYAEGAQVHTMMSGLGPFGDQKGFMTVTPQGSGAVANWSLSASSPDMVFIGDLLDDVERTACIDRRREYVTGLSNGAMMTSAIASAYSGRVAAVAPVAGVTAVTPCPLSRPVPLLAFHGTADPFVSYGGGLGAKALALPAPDGSGKTLGQLGVSGKAAPGSSVPAIMATWARRDGCATTPTVKPVAADVDLLSFACKSGVAVELYRIDGGGHAWPGSAFSASIASVLGHTTMSISADALMWAFFEAHPLTTTPTT